MFDRLLHNDVFDIDRFVALQRRVTGRYSWLRRDIMLLIGGGMKLAGMKVPVLDYEFGGLFYGPKVEVIQPDLHLP